MAKNSLRAKNSSRVNQALHGEKIRCEKVGMVSTFSQRIIRREFAANSLRIF